MRYIAVRPCLAILVLVASTTACAHARPARSWPELPDRVRIGTPVIVVDSDGKQTEGRVRAVSPGALDLAVGDATRTFASADVRDVRRNGDSLWNGLLIGAGIGTLAAMLPDARCRPGETDCRDAEVAGRVALFGIVTAVGVGIDALHKDHSLLYTAPRSTVRIVPAVGPKGAAVVILIGF